MQNKYVKDIRFILNAIGFSLLFMAVMITIAPRLERPEPASPEIDRFRERILVIGADELPLMLRSQDNKPTLLVVYASWCPTCKKLMPMLTDALRGDKLDDKVRTVFLSMDYNTAPLSKYLIHRNYQSLFTPYMLRPDHVEKLPAVLAPTGSTYNKMIPYTGIFNAQGKLVREEFGIFGKRQLMEMIEAAK